MFSQKSAIFIVTALLLFCCLITPPDLNAAIKGEVKISSGGPGILRNTIGSSLTLLVNTLHKQDLSPVRSSFSKTGYNSMVDLVTKAPMENGAPLHETKLIQLPGGAYEVRDILVNLLGNVPGDKEQFLVFTISQNGKITNVRFSALSQDQHMHDFLEEGKKLKDFAFRQQILQFVEVFRTAYNRKDLDYLKKVFSDDALIIVGKVVEKKPNMPDMMKSSHLNQKQIEFVRRSKAEYLGQLENVFNSNDMLNVGFDKVEIIRHHQKTRIYGVTLKQNWRSSRYSDEGWVFLMIDFTNETEPLIHVRSWQPKPFDDGSTISLFDFQLIQ